LILKENHSSEAQFAKFFMRSKPQAIAVGGEKLFKLELFFAEVQRPCRAANK
jgi:hypothetical protein